jgi:hypothetical protein
MYPPLYLLYYCTYYFIVLSKDFRTRSGEIVPLRSKGGGCVLQSDCYSTTAVLELSFRVTAVQYVDMFEF